MSLQQLVHRMRSRKLLLRIASLCEENRTNIRKEAILTPFGRERVALAMLGGHTREAPPHGTLACVRAYVSGVLMAIRVFSARGVEVSASTWTGLSLPIAHSWYCNSS